MRLNCEGSFAVPCIRHRSISDLAASWLATFTVAMVSRQICIISYNARMLHKCACCAENGILKQLLRAWLISLYACREMFAQQCNHCSIMHNHRRPCRSDCKQITACLATCSYSVHKKRNTEKHILHGHVAESTLLITVTATGMLVEFAQAAACSVRCVHTMYPCVLAKL